MSPGARSRKPRPTSCNCSSDTGSSQTDPKPPALILASKSAARTRLLEEAGLTLACQLTSIDEATIKNALKDQGTDAERIAKAVAVSVCALYVARDGVIVWRHAGRGAPDHAPPERRLHH